MFLETTPPRLKVKGVFTCVVYKAVILFDRKAREEFDLFVRLCRERKRLEGESGERMAGRLYYSRCDPDFLKLLVLWEVKKDKCRFDLVEGELYLEYETDPYSKDSGGLHVCTRFHGPSQSRRECEQEYINLQSLSPSLSLLSSPLPSPSTGLPSHPHLPLKSGRGLVLELPTGDYIFSSNEICQLVCRGDGGRGDCGEGEEGTLEGGTPEMRALVDYWLDWESSQLKVCGCGCEGGRGEGRCGCG